MVKNILVLLALLIVNTSAIASDKGFYIKALMGGNKVSGIKTIEEDINFKIIHRSKLSQTAGIGLGYYITSFARVDLTFENAQFSFNPKRGGFDFMDDNGIQNTGNQLIRRNANARTLMLNTYFDLIEKVPFKLFIGGGLGVSNIKEKIVSDFKRDDIVVNNVAISLPTISLLKIKKAKNTIAYALTVGSDIDLMKNFHLELAYSWKHYGKIKNCSNKYQGHNISAAIRFDL
jgi:opacity protein-like surface antigen